MCLQTGICTCKTHTVLCFSQHNWWEDLKNAIRPLTGVNASSEVDAALRMECLHYAVIYCLISQSGSGFRVCVSVCVSACACLLWQGETLRHMEMQKWNVQRRRSQVSVAGSGRRNKNTHLASASGDTFKEHLQQKPLTFFCLCLPKQHLGEQGCIPR